MDLTPSLDDLDSLTSFMWIQHSVLHRADSSFAFQNFLEGFWEIFQFVVGWVHVWKSPGDCGW
jgi:hypothetical protein